MSSAPIRRALVTGASGYLGGHLARALTADGIEVHALLRPGSDGRGLPVAVRTLRFAGTAADLTELLAEAGRPDAVFHLATNFVGAHHTQDIEPLIGANVLFTAQLAEALTPLAPAVLVNVGTAWQSSADATYRPAALYAATKQAQEDILRFYAEAGAFAVANLRLFDTYGPDDRRGKLLSSLADAARARRTLAMSPGEQLIDLLHVDDVVAALRAAAAVREPWSVWSASSGHPVTVRELVQLFSEVTGLPVQVEWGARPYRLREMFEPWDAGQTVPGWGAEVKLAVGLAREFAP